MTRRLTWLPAMLLALSLAAACGGDDSDGDPAGDPTRATEETGGSDACDLLTREEVSEAVGTELSEGEGAGGPVATGGTQSTCKWSSVDTAINAATLTIYSETTAADSVREESSETVAGVGDRAFVGPLASVWVYVGEQSFMAQWYDFEAVPEESLPQSTALAKLAADKL